MEKTLDFNKMARAHSARKKWIQLQLEKELEKAELKSKQEALKLAQKVDLAIRRIS